MGEGGRDNDALSVRIAMIGRNALEANFSDVRFGKGIVRA